jgi:undecaprenyl-diphosphatase
MEKALASELLAAAELPQPDETQRRALLEQAGKMACLASRANRNFSKTRTHPLIRKFIMSWDHQILLFAAAQRSDELDYFFRGVTWCGSLYLLTPLVVLIAMTLLYAQKRWEALLLIVGFGGAALLVHLAKIFLARPRPALVEPLIALPADSSFPSAHTTQIVAFALCLMFIIHRIWPQWQFIAAVLAIMLVVAVAASRIYLQVHYPSDVLGGIVLGIVWVTLAKKLL